MKSNRKINGIWVAVIFGCAIFLLFQYFMVGVNDRALSTENVKDVTESIQEQNMEVGDVERLPEIDAYLRFVSENNPEENGIFDNNYTKSAFNRLTDALKNLAEQKETAKVKTLQDQFDQYAEAEDNSKPKQLKNVLMATAAIMEAFQTEDNNSLKSKIEKLQNNALAIDENTPVENQSNRVEEYFEQAALVLKK